MLEKDGVVDRYGIQQKHLCKDGVKDEVSNT